MKKYITMFVIAGLYFYFYEILHILQIESLSNLFSMLIDNNVEGNKIYITPIYRLSIEIACDGLDVFFGTLLIFIFIGDTIKRIVFAYILLYILNFIRIFVTIVAVEIDTEYFTFAHDILGTMILFVYMIYVINRVECWRKKDA